MAVIISYARSRLVFNYIIAIFHLSSISWFCSHSAGEDLSSLGMKELKQLERQTRTAVERVRSKKVMIDIVAIETITFERKILKILSILLQFFSFIN